MMVAALLVVLLPGIALGECSGRLCPSFSEAEDVILTAPPVSALCKSLSDGRLDGLAANGSPFGPKEVGEIACNMVANIFDNGTIIASPSKGMEPIYTFKNGSSYLQNDYYSMWQRDAGLTMRTLVRVAKDSPAVQDQLKAYAKLLITRMYDRVESPNHNCAPWNEAMGGYCAMLGEPKYFVNGSVYDKPWGRNQNDGPAINAMVMMELLDVDGTDEVLLKQTKEKIVEALTWICDIGLDSTIDPWEMLYGQHFFVQAIQRRALMAGAMLAKAGILADSNGGNFETSANMLGTLLEVHSKDGAVTETVARPNWGSVGPKCLNSGTDAARQRPVPEYPPCELDMAVPIASLVAKAPGSSFPEVFPPHDSRILATVEYLVESMAPTYEVNDIDDALGLPGTLIGRYPGDEYSGVTTSQGFQNPCTGMNCANPWFLTTHGLAEMLYETAEAFAMGKAKIDTTNSRFLLNSLKLAKPTKERGQAINIPKDKAKLAMMLIEAGDGVLKRTKHHMLPGMHMSEQIYRGGTNYPTEDGYMKAGVQFGVRDLTWSYSSLLDALKSRSTAIAALPHAKGGDIGNEL